jgi:hypothetical protein
MSLITYQTRIEALIGDFNDTTAIDYALRNYKYTSPVTFRVNDLQKRRHKW